MVFRLLLVLLAVSPAVRAADLVLSAPTDKHYGCDLKDAGISDRELFLKFFEDLRIKAARNNSKEMADLVLFPLRVVSKAKFTVRNRDQFVEHYQNLMTDPIRAAIAAQKPERLYCSKQGIMYGDGEIWLGTEKGRIGIITLREP